MSSKNDDRKMRVSFDLDEVLFVSLKTHKTEPLLPFPLRNFFPERLRLGTPELICTAASQYGFRAYQLNAQDDDWKDKILRTAEHVRKIEHFE